MGVSLGSSDVRSRNGDSLATDQLEEKVSFMVHGDADLADRAGRLRGVGSNLSVCDRRYATVYLFPILI